MKDLLDRKLNYYDILNVEEDASSTQIKKAYKKLVLKYHPDVIKDTDNSEKFKEITKAYNVLKDEELRNEYNQHLKKNEGFFPKIDFQYCFHEFKRKKDEILNLFKIFFKNISGKNNELNINYQDNIDLFSYNGINAQEEVIKMTIDELEERLLFSDNTYVRINAAVALGYKKERKTFYSLEKIINDHSEEVKKAAIWAIGNLQLKNSIPLLKVLFKSSDSILKSEILKAVYKITGSKTSYFYEMLISTLNDKKEDNKIEALNLLLHIDRKILYDDVKEIFKNMTPKSRKLLDKVISENKIINYQKGAV